jgi:hypothetical protein
MRLALCLFFSSLAFAQSTGQQTSGAPQQPAPAPAAQGAKQEGTQPPPPQLKDSAPPVYVRRFSFGLTASFFPLTLTRGGKTTQTFTTPALEVRSEAIAKPSWFGGGATLQIALTNRLALNASGLIRKSGFILSTTNLIGFDNPNTVNDERAGIFGREDTRVAYLDFPLLVRRYNIDRQEYGNRWFVEAGPSLRRVWKVRSSRQTEQGGTTTCCDTTPASPRKSNLFGATVGVGFQLIDDFGIRVVPGVRYTRWFGSAFDTLGARDRRDQIEIHLSLGF